MWGKGKLVKLNQLPGGVTVKTTCSWRWGKTWIEGFRTIAQNILGQREFTQRFRNFTWKTARAEQTLGNLNSKHKQHKPKNVILRVAGHTGDLQSANQTKNWSKCFDFKWYLLIWGLRFGCAYCRVFASGTAHSSIHWNYWLENAFTILPYSLTKVQWTLCA